MSRTLAERSRSSASDGEHHEVITAHGGSEWSGDWRSAEWCRVGGSTNEAYHCGQAQLRCEGETGTGIWRDGGISGLKGRRQETYDIIEIGLIIDAGEPGRIGGARMGERDGSDQQKHQPHGTQAIDTRNVQAIENGHARFVGRRSVSARADVTMGLGKSSVKTICAARWFRFA